jgi:hypothetical protein
MNPRLALAGSGLLVVGCLFGPSDQLDDLDQARRRWAAAGIDSYQMVVTRACFCAFVHPEGVRVTVVRGLVASRVDVATGVPIPAAAEPFYPAVPGLFDLIEDTLQDGADDVRVRYDEEYGFPVEIDVDLIENAIDDEFTVSVAAFLPMR